MAASSASTPRDGPTGVTTRPTAPCGSRTRSTAWWTAAGPSTGCPEMADLTGPDRARYVRAMFSGITARYDLMNTVMSAGLDAAWRRTAVRVVAPTPGGLALDVACGTGALTRELAR